jgi:hypothetical protein
MQILPFCGERRDKKHGVSETKIVFGQTGDCFVPRWPSERRQLWIVDVIDVDEGFNDAEQLPGRDILVDQGCFEGLCECRPYSALAGRRRSSDKDCCWSGVRYTHNENAAIDGNRELSASPAADDHVVSGASA